MNQANNQQNICVLGAGSFGTALAILLANNGHNVCLWGHRESHVNTLVAERQNSRYLPNVSFPDNLTVSASLAECSEASTALLLVVPSHAFAETLSELKPHLHANIKEITWATKGLDPHKQIFLSELFEQQLGDNSKLAFITGPSFADELAQGMPTILTVAANNQTIAQSVSDWFTGSTVRTYTSSDLISAQIGGSLKNIIAIATGISDGLALGANARSGLITRGLAEIMRFANALGCEDSEDTLIGPAGLGDLILTATDNKSRNRKVGLLLGENKTLDEITQSLGQVAEGVITTKTIAALAKKHDIYMPITHIVYQILYNNLSPKEAVKLLLQRNN